MAANAKKHAALGYKTLKVKIGLDPDQDFERLRAVREAVGDGITLRIDANQGYTVPQAIYALRKIEKLRIQLVEQPVLASDIAGLKTVRAESPIPIMADEACFLPADALKLIKAEACDYINIKLMKAGGILNSVRIAHIADAANMRCMVGCMLEIADRPDGGRARRRLPGQHRLRRPRRQRRAHGRPGHRRHDDQGGDRHHAGDARPRLRHRPGLPEEDGEGLRRNR